MSKLIIKVCKIDEIVAHPNADKLEIAVVGGWRVITQKDLHKVGSLAVYFPPDSELDQSWTDKFGITKYCAPVKGTTRYRIKAARLRGEASFGVLHPLDNDWQIEQDVTEFYGVTKWEPPTPSIDGDSETPVTTFHTYTDIENWQNYPAIFQDDEQIIITEKLHGSNARIGKIRVDDDFVYMCGSHSVRRKEFNNKGQKSDYWGPLESVKQLLDDLCDNENNVIVFGELLGTQDMKYGLKQGAKGFAMFDIAINGQYLDYKSGKVSDRPDFLSICCRYPEIITVPVLHCGPYSKETITKSTDGYTAFCDIDKIDDFRGREGIVFKPVRERTDPVLGRVILKSVSVDYHSRKNKDRSEGH